MGKEILSWQTLLPTGGLTVTEYRVRGVVLGSQGGGGTQGRLVRRGIRRVHERERPRRRALRRLIARARVPSADDYHIVNREEDGSAGECDGIRHGRWPPQTLCVLLWWLGKDGSVLGRVSLHRWQGRSGVAGAAAAVGAEGVHGGAWGRGKKRGGQRGGCF